MLFWWLVQVFVWDVKVTFFQFLQGCVKLRSRFCHTDSLININNFSESSLFWPILTNFGYVQWHESHPDMCVTL